MVYTINQTLLSRKHNYNEGLSIEGKNLTGPVSSFCWFGKNSVNKQRDGQTQGQSDRNIIIDGLMGKNWAAGQKRGLAEG
jgi:hypothetical protein